MHVFYSFMSYSCSYVWVCGICACLCIFTWETHARCVCVCLEARGWWTLSSFIPILSHCLWDIISHWMWSSSAQSGKVANELSGHGSVCLHPLSTGTADVHHHTWIPCGDWGSKLRPSWFLSKWCTDWTISLALALFSFIHYLKKWY